MNPTICLHHVCFQAVLSITGKKHSSAVVVGWKQDYGDYITKHCFLLGSHSSVTCIRIKEKAMDHDTKSVMYVCVIHKAHTHTHACIRISGLHACSRIRHFQQTVLCTESCNHHHNQNREYFHQLPNFPHTSPLKSVPKLLTTTDLFSVPIVLSCLECHINGIIQYVPFWVWLLSLSIMHLRLNRVVVAWISSSFTFIAES